MLQALLGAGGRGTVYRAVDRYRSSSPDAKNCVALKMLHAGRHCSDQSISDLRRELHCGQLLSHPNIVNVFELDRDGDVVFFTMELLEGELLSDVMRRMQPAAMRRTQAMQIIRQLGAGLEHAHERGVVHGDLKPQNLFITREGELRILDFGAAQSVARTVASEMASNYGTPGYASCEMLEGRATDACDDLYALACVCYELLSGAHPFAARPATVARDFGVKAMRPAGLNNRQWRTLQAGLSYHRAGRSMGVHAFIHGLTHHGAGEASATPLTNLSAAEATKTLPRARAAALTLALLFIAGVGIAYLRETAAGRSAAETAVKSAATNLAVSAPVAPPSDGPPPASDAPDAGARSAGAKTAISGPSHIKSTDHQPPSTISVDGYNVSADDRYVEIRVHRDRLRKSASFTWWTEPATANQNIDYVHQAKAIQTFAPEQRSTRFYVKLRPESGRFQRDYFFVAMALPGRWRDSESVKRVQIWLPMPRDHIQASR